MYAQAFTEAAGGRKVLLANKAHTAQAMTLAGATGGTGTYIDESTAYGPAVTAPITADTWTLAPYATGIVRLKA